jgi:ankyrin repeat protein
MNWIIINNKYDKKIEEKFSLLFNKYEVSYSFITSESKPVLISDAEEYLNRIEKINNIIIINANRLKKSPSFMYLLGYLKGKKISAFCSGFKSDIPFEFNGCNIFATSDELYQYLEKKIPDYINDEKKSIAVKKLSDKGISFTVESFAEQVEHGRLENCKIFVEAGMDVNSENSHGVPMLCIAARHGSKSVVKFLLDNGAKIDSVSKDRGYSAVMDAVWKSNVDIVELLCKKKANLNFISRDGQSVLVLAVGGPDFNICKVLLKYGANPYIKDKMGMSAWDYAVLFKQNDFIKLVEEAKKINA